jgi:hypothetical protein
MSLEFLIKVLLMKKFTIFSKALGKEHFPMFPKTGPLWKQTPISRAILRITLQVPLIELPEREMLRFQSPPSFIF